MSEEAKESAAERLQNMGSEIDTSSSGISARSLGEKRLRHRMKLHALTALSQADTKRL